MSLCFALEQWVADGNPQETAEVAQAVVKAMTDHVNGYHGDFGEALAIALNGQHRTLQQSLIRQLVNLFLKYSEFRYDARNEDAVLWCQLLKGLIEDGTLSSHFRFI